MVGAPPGKVEEQRQCDEDPARDKLPEGSPARAEDRHGQQQLNVPTRRSFSPEPHAGRGNQEQVQPGMLHQKGVAEVGPPRRKQFPSMNVKNPFRSRKNDNEHIRAGHELEGSHQFALRDGPDVTK